MEEVKWLKKGPGYWYTYNNEWLVPTVENTIYPMTTIIHYICDIKNTSEKIEKLTDSTHCIECNTAIPPDLLIRRFAILANGIRSHSPRY